MKSIMISINPKWVRKIKKGEKTRELRKSSPKETPFKAYIYETKNGWGCGAVVGEFICNDVKSLMWNENRENKWNDFVTGSCVEESEARIYSLGKNIYSLGITDLKIYDTPKELSDFKMPYKYDKEGYLECGVRVCPEHSTCDRCIVLDNKYAIKRPPQSWYYCEGKK